MRSHQCPLSGEARGQGSRWGPASRAAPARGIPTPNRPQPGTLSRRDPFPTVAMRAKSKKTTCYPGIRGLYQAIRVAILQRCWRGGGVQAGRGDPGSRGAVGVPARGFLPPVWAQEAWEYHEVGTPHEPEPLAFSHLIPEATKDHF